MKIVAGLLVAALLMGTGVAIGVVVTGDAPAPAEPTPARPTPATPTPAGTPGTTGPSPACSAAGLDPVAPQPGLPGSVEDMRRAIGELAVACDLEALQELALRGARHFTYSFGDDGRPAAYWRELERSGEPVMDMLVRTLGLPHCRQGRPGATDSVVWQWPSASCADPSEEDWDAVARLYPPAQIRQMRRFGGFLGWRVGITAAGDWIFYVAGD